LARLDKTGHWRTYTKAGSGGGLPTDQVLALAPGSQDELWVGTFRAGLVRLDTHGHWRTFTKANTDCGLPADTVTVLAPDADGSLWVGTVGSVAHLRLSSDRSNVSCPSAGAIAAVIAADPDLSARDRTMAVLYDASRLDALGTGPSPQDERQRRWLTSRDRECGGSNLRSCLIDQYDDRLHELALAGLFRSPDAGLAELARQNPKSAPLYEAIYRYATIDDQRERTDVVERLIAPLLNTIDANMLDRAGMNGQDPRSVASSDDSFAAFLAVFSVDLSMTMPCAALVRRPGLMAAIGAHYGGAIDGFVLRADCDIEMPATPNFDRLIKAAETQQPVCTGTIRFSAWSEFAKTLTSIRLHRADLWKIRDLDTGDAAGEDRRHLDKTHFRAAHRALIRDARAELAKYYTKWFSLAPELAEADAARAVDAAISGAYSLCG
jgi:uncharacterized protein